MNAIRQFKSTDVPKNLLPKCFHGYAYAYRQDGQDFIVMAPSLKHLREVWTVMGVSLKIDMRHVRKVIIAGIKDKRTRRQ